MYDFSRLTKNPGDYTTMKIDEFENDHSGNYDYQFEDTLEFLKLSDSFKTFSEGLTEYMEKKCKYVKSDNLDEKKYIKERAAFLNKILKKKEIDIHYETLKNWFSDKTRPDFKNRENIFKICFALDLDLNEAVDFFYKICFDRPFNVRILDELIYYYCFLNKLSYQEALTLKDKAFEIVKRADIDESKETIHTNTIKKGLEILESEDKLMDFISINKVNFLKRNVSAINVFNELLEDIQGKDSDKKFIKIKKDKHGNNIKTADPDVIDELGLVVQDFLLNSDAEKFKSMSDMNIASVDFMLSIILNINASNRKDKKQYKFSKESTLPKLITNNFPSKKHFSDFIKASKDPYNIKKSEYSYEAIRKAIILMKFYSFWFNAQKEDMLEESLFEEFLDELSDTLASAALPNLYFGNPYDWLFLYCSTQDDPLTVFREILLETSKFEDKKDNEGE